MKPKLFSFNRFCWALILVFGLAYVAERYYVPREPSVPLDEWGQSEPLPIPEKVWGTRDDTLSVGVDVVRSWVSDGDYSALRVDSSGALWMGAVEESALRVTIVGDDDSFGSSWRVRTTEQGYLQCENIDGERWALIPKEELDKFKAYKSTLLRGDDDSFGSSWLRTTEQGYLQCENIDEERWALIPKEELDAFKAYKSSLLR